MRIYLVADFSFRYAVVLVGVKVAESDSSSASL